MVNHVLSQLDRKKHALSRDVQYVEWSKAVVHGRSTPMPSTTRRRCFDGQRTAWSRETCSHRHSCGRGFDIPRERKVSLRGGDANTLPIALVLISFFSARRLPSPPFRPRLARGPPLPPCKIARLRSISHDAHMCTL